MASWDCLCVLEFRQCGSHSSPCSSPPAVDGGGCSFSYSARGRNSCLGISCFNYLKNNFLGEKKNSKEFGENPPFEVLVLDTKFLTVVVMHIEPLQSQCGCDGK